MEIMHSIIPSFSREEINLPTVHFVSLSPLWHFEAFIKSSSFSIELYISNSLQKGFGVEILSINMIHEVWLFVEFLTVEVLDTNTYIKLNDLDIILHFG